jgi:release factor glutamine methyltransferase
VIRLQTLKSIGDVLYESSRQLLAAGVDTGSLEASLLLGHATGTDRLGLITRTGDTLSAEQMRTFEGLMARRLKREPLQYILGETEFMGLKFAVSPAVLVPRPDTETLVEAVLDLEETRNSAVPVTVADIGTGSGAIAISLAKSLPYLKVIGVDISPEAIVIAQANAERLGVSEQVSFRLGDMLGALEGPVRYLISNPPYIAAEEMAGLEPEVRDYEPHLALTPGADALHFYRLFAQEGAAFVEPGGYLVLEVGAGQSRDVAALLEARPEEWETPTFVEDLGRIERVVIARRR